MNKIIFKLAALFIAVVTTSSLYAADQNTIPSGPYFIKSVKSGKSWKGAWDIPGTPSNFKNGQSIKVWEVTRQDSQRKDRHFYIMKEDNGYYSIRSRMNLSRAYVNVDGNRTKNGTNIELWSKKTGRDADAQRFRFVHLGGGRYKIYTKSGKIICLAGRSEKNGSNVHIWDNHNGPWCEWYLVKKNSKKIYVPRNTSSSSTNASNNSTDVTLEQVFLMHKNDYRADRYFQAVDYSKLRNENNEKSISSRLNTLDETKALNWILKIVTNTGKNKNSSARYLTYSEINKVDFQRIKKSFVNRLLAAGVKKNVNNIYKSEKDHRCKEELRKILSKL